MRILQAFRLADIQTALNIKRVLERHGADWSDVEEFIEKQRVINSYTVQTTPEGEKKLIRVNIAKSCPNCDIGMLLFPVNVSNCTRVEGNYTRQWICPKCAFEEFE